MDFGAPDDEGDSVGFYFPEIHGIHWSSLSPPNCRTRDSAMFAFQLATSHGPTN
jgi:hypothetical protein